MCSRRSSCRCTAIGSRARSTAACCPRSLRRAARRLGFERPILWAYVPQAEVLIDALDPSLIIYHCVDDIAAHERIDTDSFRAAEERFAARADLVLASAPALAERMRAISANVLYAPNVADTELFARGPRARSARPGDGRACRIRGSSSPARSSPPSSTFRCSSSWPACSPPGPSPSSDPSGRAIPTPTSPRSPREPNIHLLGPRSYERAARRPARRRRRPDPLRPQRADREHLPDEGLRVPGRRTARRRDAAARALRRSTSLPRASDARASPRCSNEALCRQNSPADPSRALATASSHSWDRRLEEIADAMDAL